MCDCITQINEQIRVHQTELDVSILSGGQKDAVRVHVSTYIPYKVKTKRGQKPTRLLATYCPFCGKKYED